MTLSLHLQNWSYMDHEIAVRTSTRLFSVTKELRVRHGRITDLKVCLGAFLEVRGYERRANGDERSEEQEENAVYIKGVWS